MERFPLADSLARSSAVVRPPVSATIKCHCDSVHEFKYEKIAAADCRFCVFSNVFPATREDVVSSALNSGRWTRVFDRCKREFRFNLRAFCIRAGGRKTGTGRHDALPILHTSPQSWPMRAYRFRQTRARRIAAGVSARFLRLRCTQASNAHAHPTRGN